MAADITTIRLLIGDRVKRAVNENVGQADGANIRFQLDMYPLATGAGSEGPTGHVTILLTGTTALTSSYQISGGIGAITFLTGSPPTKGHTILATYDYNALTSGELSDILSGHTGQPYLAAANAALILAADATRFFAYTMGEKTVDKRKISSDLRELADSLFERHNKMYGDSNYNAKIWTMQDQSGTVYHGYDTAVSYLGTGT